MILGAAVVFFLHSCRREEFYADVDHLVFPVGIVVVSVGSAVI